MMKFKSYYVVWKPFMRLFITASYVSRLNRTMQYGNEKDEEKPHKINKV